MLLETTTYSAFHGYSWSSAPVSLPTAKLDQLYRVISTARGDYPDPLSVEVGLVSDGVTVAAFTIQNVDRWDSEQRASDYAALALFSIEQAASIDFIDLLNHDFFWTPSRTPDKTLDYRGHVSQVVDNAVLMHLQSSREVSLRNPRAIGSLLALCGRNSSRWICLMKAESVLKVECDNWK